MKSFRLPPITLAVVASVLTACGGSSDDNGDSGSGPAGPSSTAQWGTATPLGVETTSAVSPQVAMDSSGQAIAVWQQHDGDRNSIRANHYDAASDQWGVAEVMETVALEAFTPKVAMAPGGNAVVVWLHYDGTQYQVWVKRYDAAAAEWSDAQLISTAMPTSALAGRADIDDSGNVVVVWYQDNGGRYGIWAAHYSPASGWASPVRIDIDTGVAIYPRVAMDDSGNAVVVWYQEDGTRNNVWANRYDRASDWGGATLIESTSMDAAAPQIAMSTNGDGMAIWYGWDGARYILWANRVDGATKQWDSAQIIEADSAGAAIDAQVAMGDDGSAIAAWQTHDGTRRTLWTTRYDTKSGWGGSGTVGTVDAGFAERPQLTVDTSGTVMAVWAYSDGTRNRVWANQLN